MKGANVMKLSIVIPVYFNHDNLLPLYNDLREKVLCKLDCDYEILMVDDGSKDKSYDVICELARLDTHIIPLKLSRNFGEHAAILAGLSRCSGDCAVRKAADLQEPSELILSMLEKYRDGNKVVLATRADREEPLTQKAVSSLYAYIMKEVALPTMPKGGFDSFLIDRQIIDLLVAMKEKYLSYGTGPVEWLSDCNCSLYPEKKNHRTFPMDSSQKNKTCHGFPDRILQLSDYHGHCSRCRSISLCTHSVLYYNLPENDRNYNCRRLYLIINRTFNGYGNYYAFHRYYWFLHLAYL